MCPTFEKKQLIKLISKAQNLNSKKKNPLKAKPQKETKNPKAQPLRLKSYEQTIERRQHLKPKSYTPMMRKKACMMIKISENI
jgi:hypothetical protein